MASEARLYTFSPETRDALRKFRLQTSRHKDPQAIIYKIDRKSLEILPDDDGEIYTTLETLAEELPDNTPRFVLLSYPLDLKSGRRAAPYVLLYYMPPTANNELRMLYAGAKELMRNTAEVGRVVEVAGEEDVVGVKEVLMEN
ncbi:uncharacterized protein H6S33_000770 [Morchella sextelata]|uniref:uncharacterized protein n=1 Tax=Morchella sextelata TaxID=1174677 RepID=UPI001D04763F|nr:uncharacterized protein H6S33_000770 [Morchella sextelata]KAH0615134.1 hypothetical protein H6S33_000770 [Morchella sextelata]